MFGLSGDLKINDVVSLLNPNSFMIVCRTVLEQVALTANKFAEGNIDLNSPMWRNHLLKALSSSSPRPPLEVELKVYITKDTRKGLHKLFYTTISVMILALFCIYLILPVCI